jgi:hypothetical protein
MCYAYSVGIHGYWSVEKILDVVLELPYSSVEVSELYDFSKTLEMVADMHGIVLGRHQEMILES